ncbi:MAG: MFS transporter [Cyclobacteriaceae bacterium]|nr:MFS transporter [Cyclobacteriaceae bacterium]
MQHWKIKLSLFLNYFVFAILLNSVGTVILQVQGNYGVSESSASILEAFKDLSIAFVSFLIASYIVRIGYKNTMLIALALISFVCFLMPSLNSFAMTKVLFAATGTSFALIKVSVYATIGIVTDNKKDHASFMNFIESFFMIGILTGYFIFSMFVSDENPQSTEWFKVYYLLGGITIVAFLLLLSTSLDESSVASSENKAFVQEFLDMIKLAIKPLVLVFIFSAFIYVLIEQSVMSWLPTFNSKVLQLPITLSIQMASILAASTAIGRFAAGVVLRKIHWFNVLVICLLSASVLVLVAIPLAQIEHGPVTGWGSAPIGAFVFPFIGLFLAPIYPAINSVILSTLPKAQHGPMSGLIVIFSALGGTTGSIITGNIFESFGGESAFYFSLVPITLLIVLLFFFNRLQKKSDVEIQMSTTASH